MKYSFFYSVCFFVFLSASAYLILGNASIAADSPGNNAAEHSPGQDGFFEIVFSGGVTGFLIVMLLLVLSITLVAPWIGRGCSKTSSRGGCVRSDSGVQSKTEFFRIRVAGRNRRDRRGLECC
mgnify:CR=1 FL=1